MQQQQQGKELSPKGASLLSDSPAAAEGADGPLGQTARKSLSRLGDFRPGSSSSNSAQHSVRSLIESIENASKQAKGANSPLHALERLSGQVTRWDTLCDFVCVISNMGFLFIKK